MTAFPAARRALSTDATVTTRPAADGWPIRVFDRPAIGARGSILWLGGRGDIIEKYLECFAQWHAEGWQVTSFDWRGQGGSGRILPDRSVGHAADFAPWLADLEAFWGDWKATTPGPHVLMGHSMGGHLVLRALAERRVAPDAVVLSAPMLGFEPSPVPLALAGFVASMLGRIVPTRKAWPENERPAPREASRQAFLTHDPERYADELWWKARIPELALGPPSWAWVAAAYRSVGWLDTPGRIESIDVPMLLIGTEGDQLVSPKAIHRTAARVKRSELLMFDASAAHEVLREVDKVRDAALARIGDFLDRNAPAR
jgi:lysophospholipase